MVVRYCYLDIRFPVRFSIMAATSLKLSDELKRMFPFYDDRVRVVSAGSYLRFRLFWSLALVDTLPFFPGKAEGRRTHAASNRL